MLTGREEKLDILASEHVQAMPIQRRTGKWFHNHVLVEGVGLSVRWNSLVPSRLELQASTFIEQISQVISVIATNTIGGLLADFTSYLLASRAPVCARFFFKCQIAPSQRRRSKCTKKNYPAHTGSRTLHVSPAHRTETRTSLSGGPFLPCRRPNLRRGTRSVCFRALWG